jgi:hypothetical protein
VWLHLRPGTQGIAFHPPPPAWLGAAADALAGWVLPHERPLPVGLAVLVGSSLVASLVASVWLPRRRGAALRPSERSAARLSGLLGGYLAAYLGLILLVRTLWDAGAPLDSRILAPLLPVAGALLLPYFARRSAERDPAPSRSQQSALTRWLVLAWAVLTLAAGSRWLTRAAQDGLGYNSLAWRSSPVLAAARALPEGTWILTNGEDALAHIAGRVATRLPDRVSPTTLAPNPRYQRRLRVLRTQLENGGVLVYLRALPERWYLPTESELVAAWRLEPVLEAADGGIYRLAERR